MEVGFAFMDICETPSAIGEKSGMDRALLEVGRVHTVGQRKNREEGAALRVEMDWLREVCMYLFGREV